MFLIVIIFDELCLIIFQLTDIGERGNRLFITFKATHSWLFGHTIPAQIFEDNILPDGDIVQPTALEPVMETILAYWTWVEIVLVDY